jgi:hypothetical protein
MRVPVEREIKRRDRELPLPRIFALLENLDTEYIIILTSLDDANHSILRGEA